MAYSIDNVCSFSIDTSIPCLLIQWHGYATSTQLRQLAENQIELMRQHKLTKVLSDNTHARMVSMEDQRWIAEDWLPRVLAIGYEACAIITSKDYFAQMSFENIVTNIGDQLTIQYFDDIESAREWLANYPSRATTADPEQG